MDQPTSSQNVHPHGDQPTSGVPTRTQPTWNDSVSQMDAYAEKLRVQLPAAPPGLADGYVKFAPWVYIVLGALGILFSLGGLLFSAVLGPIFLLFGGVAGASLTGALILVLIVSLLSNVLELVGGYMMLQRKATGWWIIAVGMAITLLNSLFGRSFLVIIVVLLLAYIHLQVKPNYRET